MKNAIIIILVVIIIGGGLAFYFVTQKSENDNHNANVNTNTSSSSNLYSDKDFSIKKPTGWQQTAMQSTLVTFRNSNETFPQDSAAARVNFKSYITISFDNAQGRTFSEIVDFIKDEVKKTIPSAEYTKQIQKSFNGQQAEFIEAETRQQDVNYKVLMAIINAGDKYYFISCNTTQDKWDEYKDMFYSVCESFKLKTSESTNTNTSTNTNSDTTNSNTSDTISTGSEAPYVITSDPDPNTKHFMLDLVNGKFNYEKAVVNPGDTFRITLMEEGSLVEFTFPSTGQTSTNGTFSTEVAVDAVAAEVPMTCLNKECGEILLVISDN